MTFYDLVHSTSCNSYEIFVDKKFSSKLVDEVVRSSLFSEVKETADK